jgi:hypothetical protein
MIARVRPTRLIVAFRNHLQALNINLNGMFDLKSPFIDPLYDLRVLLVALRLPEFHMVIHIIPAREQHEDVLLSPVWSLFILMTPTSGELAR